MFVGGELANGHRVELPQPVLQSLARQGRTQNAGEEFREEGQDGYLHYDSGVLKDNLPDLKS